MRYLIAIFLLSASMVAQQAQTGTAPLQAVNAKYQQGVGTGYWPTAGAGLTLNLAAGTSFCSGAIATYAGGTLAMANNTTNYVYLNTASSCVPATKTTTFTVADVPVAVVVTAAGAITSITDDRNMFTWFPPGTGTVTNVTGVSPIASTGGTTPAISLKNSAAANVTTAYGTDTAYFTGSGGATTLGHGIVGDSNGGIKDSGAAAGTVTSITATSPIVVTPSPITGAGTVSCPTCVTGPFVNVTGGLVGGQIEGNPSGTKWAPFSMAAASTPVTNGFYEHLSVVQNAATTNTGVTQFWFGQTNDVAVSTDNFSDLGRLSVLTGSSTGVQHEYSGVSPYHYGEGVAGYMQSQTRGSGSLSVAGWSADIYGTTAQPMSWTGPSNINTATTLPIGFGQATTVPAATESNKCIPLPFDSIAKNLVFNSAAIGGSGTFVATFRYAHPNGAFNSSALSYSAPASSGAGYYGDFTNTQSLSAGDCIDVQFVNNSGSTVTLNGVKVDIVPNDGIHTGIIFFQRDNVSAGAGGTNQYYGAFAAPAANTTEANVEIPMPRAAVIDDLYCAYTAAPSVSATLTMVKNGSTQSLAVTIPISACGSPPCEVNDTVDNFSINQYDTTSLQFFQASGSLPTFGSCAVGVR